MKEIHAAIRANDAGLVDVMGGDLADLRRRPDFDAVLDYLQARGYLNIQRPDGEIGFVRLTNNGMTYFEDNRDATNERRWNRGLAIAAIIISLLALALEMDDRGFLGGALSRFKSTRSAAQSSED